MTFRLRKSTADKCKIALACDPAVIAACGGAAVDRAQQHLDAVPLAAVRARVARLGADATDADRTSLAETEAVAAEARAQLSAARAEFDAELADFRRHRDSVDYVPPPDACLFTIRPLTAAQRVAAVEAAAGKPGASSLTAYAAVALPAAVEKVEQGGESYRIADFIDAIADDAELINVLTELVDVVRSMSGLDAVGKAPSGPRAG